ncbi:DUF3135 domain-containing protein [Sessilibacter sp. MAH4]
MQKDLPDFDTLMELAKNDPTAFEALREQYINAVIENSPVNMQRRLRGLQFQIDAKRKTSSTPMKACITLSAMMHDSFDRLRRVLNEGLDDLPVETNPTISAKILAFETTAAAQ